MDVIKDGSLAKVTQILDTKDYCDCLDQPSWVNDSYWKKVKKEMRKELEKFKQQRDAMVARIATMGQFHLIFEGRSTFNQFFVSS